MKSLFPIFLSLPLLLPAQETAPAPENPAPVEEKGDQPEAVEEVAKPQFVIDLESLPEEELKEYNTLMVRAQTLFQQKRIFECLEVIEDIHKIYDKDPTSLNLQGACYVEFRNFEKARMAFAKTEKASPNNFNVRFNLAEIEFVSRNFKEALTKFESLLEDAIEENPDSAMIPIFKFKMLLCRLKVDDEAGARELIAGLDFLDDSPLFYYGNAALAYHADKRAKAEEWLARVGRIYRQTPNVLAPWQDTLIEFGYIKSFYGADLEVEESMIPDVPVTGE